MRSQTFAAVFAASVAAWTLGACSSGPRSAVVDIPPAPSVVASADPAHAAPSTSASSRPAAHACKPRCVPGSDVDDTDENRRAVAFVAAYVHAVESLDAAAVLALASPRYLDPGETPDPADDIDYATLGAFTKETFAKLARFDVKARVTGVHRDGDHLVVECTLEGTYVFKGTPTTTKAQPPREVVIVLERDGDALRALKGL